jgi:hypothetical protein
MPAPHLPAIARHQILADPTGRRGRRLAVAGRIATTVLGLWLVVLILGGLGLQPLAGIPILGALGGREAAPPALPQRLRIAVVRRATVAPTVRVVPLLPSTAHLPPRNPSVTAPSGARTLTPTRTSPATTPSLGKTTPGPRKTSPGRAPTNPTPSPSLPTTTPSTTPPGQAREPPGQTREPPGKTKTGPGPPASTPGTGPVGNGKAHGANATVTTP